MDKLILRIENRLKLAYSKIKMHEFKFKNEPTETNKLKYLSEIYFFYDILSEYYYHLIMALKLGFKQCENEYLYENKTRSRT